MQYISRSDASKKYEISLVTLDKYLKLGRIYTSRRKGKILIDQNWLEQYMELKDQMGWPFQNKTLFEEVEQTWTQGVGGTQEKQEHQDQKTELAMIAGFQWIIQSKDDLLEQKNKEISMKETQVRYWSNWFFVMFVLFVCSVLFLLYILQ